MRKINWLWFFTGLGAGILGANAMKIQRSRGLAASIPSETSEPKRRELATFRSSPTMLPAPSLQYLVLPYARLQIDGQSQELDHLTIGDYTVWRDTPENWNFYLDVIRPAKHLEMYADRDGKPISELWIATSHSVQLVSPERWQQLVGALFYLVSARVRFDGWRRPKADDFYFEHFDVPAAASSDSASHVRYSKYGAAAWSKLRIYPSPDVSKERSAIVVPGKRHPLADSFEGVAVELYQALDKELATKESRVLAALWFFQESRYRSAARSSFAEDIQNICTAFEALLNIKKRGDSAMQVADELELLFADLAPSPIDEFTGEARVKEDPLVLRQLRLWTAALYDIRNAYTHGKSVKTYLFFGQSIWQDAFEIFHLAANRVILGHPEARPLDGSELSRLLMSGIDLDDVVDTFRRRHTVSADLDSVKGQRRIREVLHRARRIDPARVAAVHSIPQLRAALFALSSIIYIALKKEALEDQNDQDLQEIVLRLEHAYEEATNSAGQLSVEDYLNRIAPIVERCHRLVPVAGEGIYTMDFSAAFERAWAVYEQFTGRTEL